jgi:SARP family transcriptional regulator, regulator of embCAB operon
MTTHASRTAARTGKGRSEQDRMQVRFLGGFHLRIGTTTVGPRQLGGTKPRLILEALLAHGGAPVSKDRLVAMLWKSDGAKGSTGSRANLETYTCVLRKHLHQAAPGAEDVIGSVAGSYLANMDLVDLDLDRHARLVRLATDARTTACEALPLFIEALTLGDAALLPEEGDLEWLVDLRRLHAGKLRSQLVQGAVKVLDLAPALSRHWALTALRHDELDEAAWIAYLSSVEALGFHAEGLRAYNDCRRVFSRELGCAPGRVLQEAYVRLLRGANEANGELSHLLDAVVSLHSVAGSGSPSAAGRSSGQPAVPPLQLEEARGALTSLLTRVGTTSIGGAAAARTA